MTASNFYGEGPRSDSSEATTDKRAPDAPSAFKAANQTPFTIELSWIAPAQDGGSEVTGYIVSYAAPNSPVKTAKFTETEGTLTDLLPETIYDMSVQATNDLGEGEKSMSLRWSTLQAPPEPPSAVTNVRAVSSSSTSINVNWIAPAFKPNTPDVQSYVIMFAKKDTETGEYPAEFTKKSQSAPGTTTVLSGL